MKIVQIASHDGSLYGLDENGKLYTLNQIALGFGLFQQGWVSATEKYGSTKQVIEEVVGFIAGQCYTSTDIIQKVIDRYGRGVQILERYDTYLALLSNDRRAKVEIILGEAVIEEGEQRRTAKSVEVRTDYREGGKDSVLFVNRKGGTYERY